MADKYNNKIRNNKIISASDIGQYSYCSISWYLNKLGIKPNSENISKGVKNHYRLGVELDNSKKFLEKTYKSIFLGFLFLFISIIFLFFGGIL